MERCVIHDKKDFNILKSCGTVIRCYAYIVFPARNDVGRVPPCLGSPVTQRSPIVYSIKVLRCLGCAVLRCLTGLNSDMKLCHLHSGSLFRLLPHCCPVPLLTLPLSRLGPGQVVVEVTQLLRLLL